MSALRPKKTGASRCWKVHRDPWLWVPSIYMAEGIPYMIAMTVSVVLYKNLDEYDNLRSQNVASSCHGAGLKRFEYDLFP